MYGNPIPRVTWFKDGVPLDESEEEGRTVEVDKTLVIQKARRNSKHDDSGEYYCYAESEVGNARSEPARINVKCKLRDNNIFLTIPVNIPIKFFVDVLVVSFICVV